MELVEDHRSNAVERGVVEDHAGEHALGDNLDPGLRRDLLLQADAVADGLADLLAERLGHAAGGGAGGEPARLQHQDAAILPPGRVEQRQGHTRRLAGAGRRHQHGVVSALQRGFQFGKGIVDGQHGCRHRGGWAFVPVGTRFSRRCGWKGGARDQHGSLLSQG